METPTAPIKPQVWLSTEHPKTHPMPVHPETGELWQEKYDQLLELNRLVRDEAKNVEQYHDLQEQWKQAIKGIYFRHSPFFVQHTIQTAVSKPDGSGVTLADRPSYVIGCHPETFAGMDEEFRNSYTPVDIDAFKARLAVANPEIVIPFQRVGQQPDETGGARGV